MQPSMRQHPRMAMRLLQITVVASLSLASIVAVPRVTSAENESIFVQATTGASDTTVTISLNGDVDTTYYASVYAAASCASIVAPGNFLFEASVTTDPDFGEAFAEQTVTPVVPVGWFVAGTVATELGGTPIATSNECGEVTQEGLYPLGLQGTFLVEPDRDRLILDYTPPEDAICDSSLDGSSVPDPSDFAATLDGTPITIASVEIPAAPCPTSVIVHFGGVQPSGLVQLAYTPGAFPLRNLAGDPADPFDLYALERASATIAPGTALGTDGEADGATGTDPIETILTTSTAAGGEVTITEQTNIGLAGPGPHEFLGMQVGLTAPAGSAAEPINVEFVLDSAALSLPFYPFVVPTDQVAVFRHGAQILPCDGGAGSTADPEPCESARSVVGDDLHVTIRTAVTTDLTWTFGHNLPPDMIAIESESLATLDHAILWFTEQLDLSSLPAPEDFTVTADGNPLTVTDVDLLLSGFAGSPVLLDQLAFTHGVTFLELRWSGSVPSGSAIEVSYTPGADPIRDPSGAEMPATTFTLALIGNLDLRFALLDEGPGPDHVIFFIDGSVAEPLPPPTDFEILIDGVTPVTPTAVDLRYPHLGFSLIDLTLPAPIDPGSFVTMTYDEGAIPLMLEGGALIGDQVLDVAMSLSYESPRATEPDPGNPVSVSPPDSSSGATYATITFPEVTGSGITTFQSDIETTAPPIPVNFSVGDPPAYFEISTTATFVPPAEVCITYNPGAYADENDVRLLHFEGGIWSDVTSSLDTVANEVCGTVATFSPFAIAEVAGGPDFTVTGFFAPVDNPPVLNTVSAGRAIPVKFSLGGAYGLDIFADGSPSSVRVACPSAMPLDSIETTVPTTSSTLTYDPASDRYNYVWKTERSWAGTCRLLTIEFADGDVATALFKFGK